MTLNNEKKNVISGLIYQFLALIIGFVIRKLLVDKIGVYLIGVNGVYENTISMLSLLNFGIGSACIYYLYKAFSHKQYDEIVSYYQAFVKLFRYVAIAISVIGIVFLININWIVNTNANNISFLRLFFFVHLLRAIASFLFTCPRYALQCDEKRYYCTFADTVCLILFGIFKAFALVYTKSYIVYLVLSLLETIVSNAYIYVCFNKQYKDIDFTVKKEISKETKNVISYAKHLAISNVNYFINNCTDNIVVSKICGEIAVGMMSNYYLIVDAVKGFTTQLFSSIEATIIKKINLANSYLEEVEEYNLVTFVSYVISSFVSIFLFALTDSFIKLYFGSEFSMGNSIALLMTISLAITIYQNPSTNVLTAKGLNNKIVIYSVIMMISNISSSVLLALRIGPKGVLYGTILANVILLVGQDYAVYKYVFIDSPKVILTKYIYMLPQAAALFVIKLFIPNEISIITFAFLVIKCVVVFAVLLVPFYKAVQKVISINK